MEHRIFFGEWAKCRELWGSYCAGDRDYRLTLFTKLASEKFFVYADSMHLI